MSVELFDRAAAAMLVSSVVNFGSHYPPCFKARVIVFFLRKLVNLNKKPAAGV